ncbi:MAG: leucyl aminopeptidase [candidate division Zixibacteria bacterium]
MNCKLGKGRIEDYSGDALIAFVYQNENRYKGALKGVIDNAVKSGRFSGEKNELFQVFPCGDIKSGRLIIVGLGKKSKADLDSFRKAAGVAIKAVRKLNKAAFAPIDNSRKTLAPIIEGALLGSYRFDILKTTKKKLVLTEIAFFSDSTGIGQAHIDRVQAMTEGTLVARDFVNLPANILTPSKLAADAKRLGRKNGISVKELSEAELKRLKMEALLSVGKGSENRPRMIVWEYNGGRKNDKPIVFVGKGVTFDSGGLSLKQPQGMEAMKGDMGGAGAVISLIPVLGKLKPKINVVGITPLVENMPSGMAYRPGDVLTASNGKTIEVISTDAEGRLILADALVYAGRFKPKMVVDIATLTGACMVALGVHICAGVMGTDQQLIDQLIKAGDQSGERLWQLPLWREYGEFLKTPAADIKNGGGRWGGAITAGWFLSNFAEGYKWAHVDIAGMDLEESGNHPYRYKGGTGWGVRLLARFILNKAGMK